MGGNLMNRPYRSIALLGLIVIVSSTYICGFSRFQNSSVDALERAAINYAKGHPRLSLAAGAFCISGLVLVSYLNSLRYTISPVIGLNQARNFAEVLNRARVSSGYVRS